MKDGEISAFLNKFPPHLEPILFVNDTSTVRPEELEEGSDYLEIHTHYPTRMSDERVDTILATIGMLFCQDHDFLEDEDEDQEYRDHIAQADAVLPEVTDSQFEAYIRKLLGDASNGA